jgi:hypothetical protein
MLTQSAVEIASQIRQWNFTAATCNKLLTNGAAICIVRTDRWSSLFDDPDVTRQCRRPAERSAVTEVFYLAADPGHISLAVISLAVIAKSSPRVKVRHAGRIWPALPRPSADRPRRLRVRSRQTPASGTVRPSLTSSDRRASTSGRRHARRVREVLAATHVQSSWPSGDGRGATERTLDVDRVTILNHSHDGRRCVTQGYVATR